MGTWKFCAAPGDDGAGQERGERTMTTETVTMDTHTAEVRTDWKVRTLGYIWMPNDVLCAQEYTVDHPMEYPRAEGETETEYEARMAECAAEMGDFSKVTACEVERVTTVTRYAGSRRMDQETTYTLLTPFTDEQNAAWIAAMYGDEE